METGLTGLVVRPGTAWRCSLFGRATRSDVAQRTDGRLKGAIGPAINCWSRPIEILRKLGYVGSILRIKGGQIDTGGGDQLADFIFREIVVVDQLARSLVVEIKAHRRRSTKIPRVVI